MESEDNLLVVVEDDLGLQRALGRLLQAAGFHAQLFNNAEEMEISGASTQARCLVLDIDLPGISGLGCYARLSEPRPPVLFMTAHDTPFMRQAVAQAGSHEILIKPFKGSDLLARIETAIARANKSSP